MVVLDFGGWCVDGVGWGVLVWGVGFFCWVFWLLCVVCVGMIGVCFEGFFLWGCLGGVYCFFFLCVFFFVFGCLFLLVVVCVAWRVFGVWCFGSWFFCVGGVEFVVFFFFFMFFLVLFGGFVFFRVCFCV